MIIRSPQDLGALARDRRKELGWSQSELAGRVGVRRLWVSHFEGGKSTAQIGLVMRTLQELDLQVWVGTQPETSSSTQVTLVDLDTILARNRNRTDK